MIYKPVKKLPGIGDTIVITGNQSGHNFPIGTCCNVFSIHVASKPYIMSVESRDKLVQKIHVNSNDYKILYSLR